MKMTSKRVAALAVAIVSIALAHAAAPAILAAAAATAPAGGAQNEGVVTAADERMRRRFPQPVRVADLIGLPLLDNDHRTLGHIRAVVRTENDKIKLVLAYSRFLGFFGWDTRPVAVPIEVVGIRGRELASLDMPRSEYVTAPTWQPADAAVLPTDATVLVALCRGY
jgi:hypothetical protein